MSRYHFIAVDLGAESGRVLLATLENNIIELQEAHRFFNTPVKAQNELYWDFLRQWHEIKTGITSALKLADGEVLSIGVDTWGVDFGLLDKNGKLLGNPVHYRDNRTDNIFETAFQNISRGEVFGKTGIQFMPINTLFQLLAMKNANSVQLENAESLLFMPDLFNYMLTGEKVSEFTIATTSQCYNPIEGNWAYEILKNYKIPTDIFKPIIQPGDKLGQVQKSVGDDIGKSGINVIAPACHDTGSAVAAIPAENSDFGYISSGTWSLVGVEVKQPIINDESLQLNMTNEGGVNGTYRLLKNVTGLWMAQECRREWQRMGTEYSYSELAELAEKAKPFQALVNPDDERFMSPGDMPNKVMRYCAETGQILPNDVGSIMRCLLESLALKYRSVVEGIEHLTGNKPSPMHIVGGGCRNRLLQQFTANALNTQVIAGPVEATALGNAIMQAVGMGILSNVEEGRQVSNNSSEVAVFEPAVNLSAWQDAYGKFIELK